MQFPTPRSDYRAAVRTVSAAAVATLVGLSLVSCATDSGATTLTVQAQPEQIAAFEKVAEAFEADHEGVTVEFQSLTNEQKITTNAQILASNDAPDIGIVPPNAQSYTDLLQADALQPLDGLWESADLETRYGAATADALKFDGTPYIALFGKTYYNVIFYNEQAFAEAGITVAENRQIASNDELYGIVDALEESGYEGVATGGNDGYKWGWLLDAQLFANAPTESLDDYLSSWRPGQEQKVDYTEPAFSDSVTQLKAWFDNGVFPEGVLAQSDDQSTALFISGKAAMFLGGAFSPASLDDQKPGFDYDWLLLPGADADHPTLPTTYAGDAFAIPKNAKNPELAEEFIELLLSDEMQSMIAETNGTLPAVNTADPAGIPSLGEHVQTIVAYAQANGTGTGWTSLVPGSLGQSFFDPQMQKVLSGEQTVADLAKNQQQQYETFTANG